MLAAFVLVPSFQLLPALACSTPALAAMDHVEWHDRTAVFCRKPVFDGYGLEPSRG